VISPGLATRVVDLGRPRSRSLGVPVGGAADRTSYLVGNALVGNGPDAALEITLAGPTLEATCDLACVVFGAPFDLESDRQPLRPGRTFTLHEGESLRIGGTPEGARAYLCVGGGLQTRPILDSRTALAPLAAGEQLPCRPGTIRPRFLLHRFNEPDQAGVLRVLEGAQSDWFTQAEFYDQDFAVTPSSDRMGLRLRGMPLTMPNREIVSEPVCPGSVQVTRDGQCIVLGVDGQTIGGYPKIAQVIAVDVDKLGQLRPGAKVRFRRVGMDEAVALYRKQQADLHRWLLRLRTAERVPS
jgi:antagonist of KipI